MDKIGIAVRALNDRMKLWDEEARRAEKEFDLLWADSCFDDIRVTRDIINILLDEVDGGLFAGIKAIYSITSDYTRDELLETLRTAGFINV